MADKKKDLGKYMDTGKRVIDDKKALKNIKTNTIETGPMKGRLKDAFLKNKFK